MSINPKNDFAFSYVFGRDENKDLLTSLLNSILRETDNQPIIELEIANPELLPSMVGQKAGRLDIRVHTSDGRHVNVEIQLVNHFNIEKRTLFYWSRMLEAQLPTGEDYTQLGKTITINILDFSYLPGKHYHSIHHLRDQETLERTTDMLEIHFIELPKFRMAEKDLESTLVKWLLFLDDSKMREVISMKDPLIEKACCELQRIHMDPAARRLYELRDLGIRDEKSLRAGAWAEGKAEGWTEGKEEARQETARNLIRLGLDLLLVSEATGLPLENLKTLMND